MVPSPRRILDLAIPMAGEQFLIYGIVLFDTALAGQLGVIELSAQGAVSRWVNFASVLFNIPVVGGSILIAQAIGGWDERRAAEILTSALWLSLAGGLGLMLLIVAASPLLMSVLGLENAVSDLGVPYLQMVALSFPLQFVMLTAGGCIRSAGDPRTSLTVMVLANGLHALVAVGLVSVLSWGLKGIAVAQWIGTGAGAFLFLLILVRGRVRGLTLHRPQPSMPTIRQITQVGGAVGGEQLALRLGQLVNVNLVAPLGTVALAAYFSVLNSLALVLLIGMGFGMAALTLVGQQIGAGHTAAVYATNNRVLRRALLIIGGIVAVLFVWPNVTRLFTSDPTTQRMAASGLRVILLGTGFEIVNQVLTGSIRGAGDTRFPMLNTTLGQWLVRIPLILLLVHPLGLNGVWVAMIIEMGVRATLNLWRWRTRFWLAPALRRAPSNP